MACLILTTTAAAQDETPLPQDDDRTAIVFHIGLTTLAEAEQAESDEVREELYDSLCGHAKQQLTPDAALTSNPPQRAVPMRAALRISPKRWGSRGRGVVASCNWASNRAALWPSHRVRLKVYLSEVAQEGQKPCTGCPQT